MTEKRLSGLDRSLEPQRAQEETAYLPEATAIEYARFLKPHYFSAYWKYMHTPVKKGYMRVSPYVTATNEPSSPGWNPFFHRGSAFRGPVVCEHSQSSSMSAIHRRVEAINYWDPNENMDLLLERRPRVREVFQKIAQHQAFDWYVVEKNMLAVYCPTTLSRSAGAAASPTDPTQVYTNRVFIIAWNPSRGIPSLSSSSTRKRCKRVLDGTLRSEYGCFTDGSPIGHAEYVPPYTPGAIELVPLILASKPVGSPTETTPNEISDTDIASCFRPPSSGVGMTARLIGWVIPEWGSMITSDIVHSKIDATVTAAIWPILDKEFFGGPALEDLPECQEGLQYGSWEPKEVIPERPRIKVTVGCDPEFELVDPEGYIYSGGRYLRETDHVGIDGAGNEVELRPEPAKSASRLIKNIKDTLREFIVSNPRRDLSTAGNRYPLGGHIHIGVGCRWQPTPELLGMLDDFLGRPFLNLSGPSRGSYKRLSAMETKRYGFEYRTPPAAIFLRPDICRITHKITKNVVEYYINEKEVCYSVPPTDEDYMRIAGLSASEVITMRRFLADYPRTSYASRRVLAHWMPEYDVRSAPEPDYDGYDDEGDYDDGYRVEDPQPHRRAEERIRIGRPQSGFLVVFHDDWSPLVKNSIVRYLRRARFRFNPSGTLYLYGLAAHRGDLTSTTPIRGLRQLPRPIGLSGIGLSRDLRMDFTLFLRHRRNITEAVKQWVCDNL